MTKKIIYGRYKKINSEEVPAGYKSMEDWIINYNFEENENGFFFDVVLDPIDDLNSPEAKSVELFNPILSRKKPLLEEISPYQILHKREESCKVKNPSLPERYVNYNTLDFDSSSLSTFGRVREYVFGTLLQHAVRDLKFKIVKIISIIAFKQKNWMKNYIIKNQERRKVFIENKDTVGSNAEKLKNNTCFGGHSVSPKRPRLNIIYNYLTEAENYYKMNEDIITNNNNVNPWLINERHIEQKYNKDMNEEFENLSDLYNKKQINKDQFLSALDDTKQKLELEKDNNKKFIKKVHTRKKNVSADDMINEFQKNKTFKDIYYNQNENTSIQAIISSNPKY